MSLDNSVVHYITGLQGYTTKLTKIMYHNNESKDHLHTIF